MIILEIKWGILQEGLYNVLEIQVILIFIKDFLNVLWVNMNMSLYLSGGIVAQTFQWMILW